MIVKATWAMALYCQRCGKLHIHDISYFEPLAHTVCLRCSCGYQQAVLARTVPGCFALSIPCVVCDSVHYETFASKKLVRIRAEKIYCAKDHFELGYVGKRERIEEILAFNKHEFASLGWENSEEQMEKQQVLLDVLNRLHDIAELGGIDCPCGKAAISADIVGSSVILECSHCGSYYIVPAKAECDLKKLIAVDEIELLQKRFLVKNIDLD